MIDGEEYLRTSFEDADCEYLDGEIADRNAGEWPHAETMGTIRLRRARSATRSETRQAL